MGADDHGDTPGSDRDGDARPGGDEPGRDEEEDRFEALFECLGGIGDAGAKAEGFLDTARLLLCENAPALPRRGEAVAFCVRQAADSILESAGSLPDDQRWEVLSREVVSAKGRYEGAKRFDGDGSEAALAELLAEVDALDEFHREAPTRSERQAAAAHARLTGSYAVRDGLEPVRDFLRVRNEAARRLHSTCSLADAGRLLSECVDTMLEFLRSTADKGRELAELAGRASPGSADLEAAQRLIINDNDIEEFLGSVADPAWLELLYRDGRLDLPGSHRAGWATRMAAIRLSVEHRQRVRAWLLGLAAERRRDPTRCAAVVDVLLSMDGPEFEAALDIADRHPRDASILWHFARSLEGVDPSDSIVERCADIFLNALIPEGQPAEPPADFDWNSIPEDLAVVLRMLSDGADEQNAGSRIRLLLLKIGRMPFLHGAHSLLAMGTNQQLPIASLAEGDPEERYGEQGHAVMGCLVSIMAKAMGWLPAAELLELAEGTPGELASRLRTWILAAAADADPEEMATEIEDAIGSRSPNCDDVALLDRVAAEFGPDGLADRWRAALGDPPSVAETSRALASGEQLPDWLFPYLWSGLLPESAASAWADAPATLVLAAQIGSPETRSYYLGLRDDPDRDTMAVWVQSPLTAEHLRGLGPERAAEEIAGWRPQPHDSPSAIILIADVLEQLVRDDPAGWLAEPLAIAVRLFHPTYIARYLRAAGRAAKENPAAIRQSAVGGLIDVMVMAQEEPWPAEPLGTGRQGDRYDTSWDQTRFAGTDLVKALLDSGAGLNGRDDEVWRYLKTEAETNPHIFEAFAPGLAGGGDPIERMLDNAGSPNTAADPRFLAINQAGTRAVDAALSLIAKEHQTTQTVRSEAAGLVEWCLRQPGIEGAKHRAIIAPAAALLHHIVPDWFDQNRELLFGEDAPGLLGQLTVDQAVTLSHPWEWVLANYRDSIYDSASRGVKRSPHWLLLAMFHQLEGYEPGTLVQRLGDRVDEVCGALAGLLDRFEEITPGHLEILGEFCEAVIAHRDGQSAAALGSLAHADSLDFGTWAAITLKALDKTGGRIQHAHKIVRRILDNPATPDSASILTWLVEVQTNHAFAQATAATREGQPASFDGAWPRRLIADQAADWLAGAEDRGARPAFIRLEQTLIRHRLLSPTDPQQDRG